MTPSPDTILQPAPDVVFRDLGGETVLLHLGSATYFGLDEVGSRVWELIAEGRSLRQVCEALAREFDAPAAQIDADVGGLVGELLKKDLVRASA